MNYDEAGAVVERGEYKAGSQLLNIRRKSHHYWVHEDAITKGQRTTDVYGNVTPTVELTSYTRDLNGDHAKQHLITKS